MRTIDADELKEWVENWFYKNKMYHPYSKSNNIPIEELYDILKNMSTIDAEPVRHGKWIYQEYKGIKHQNIGYYVCSKCGYVVFGMDKMNRYCSYCGAKMEGEEE